MALVLAGCGAAHLNRTRNAYEGSLAAYKACVHAKGPDQCRSEKAIMDADSDAYTSARSDGTINVRQK
jgi:hypothetical protein